MHHIWNSDGDPYIGNIFEVETTLPNGKPMKLHIRDIDVENVNRLRKMESIIILDRIEDIERIIAGLVENEESQKK
jgi:hypothetical protein